ncbi:hypothetical protein TVAG_102720 [Trichomonas vaginalis G3]|uniref:Uncharacterized protein n=1 Tax=Trichomonas vaginalis (strain ATCC PRA-98 / G3) TaxID=412133 RepID=A2ECX8_TRIV3|nr:cilium movement involved in cell motility [Trichomonas vaginalis G3]EAY09523.1 hypothetical protein TVAG_102720 [Trichomonas vaginalis G3]KAI5512984.1 cilium movement involved in cell motility [Trichomonas vaginalis G3]|eukprot:XP_001321746.1 hypothetical protein [Trichomonas vaginalis G3]
MEQSLRLLLTSNTKITEQSLLNAYNKLTSPSSTGFSSDLFILLAERLFDLPPPIQKHIVDKAENMVLAYNRLQEPMNQFQVRAQIIQSLINNWRGQQHRGQAAIDLNLKAIDFITRALKSIQSTTLYQPLTLRAVFTFYQISLPFFPSELRHYLQTATPIALQLLETQLVTGEFNSTTRLYVALSLLNGCLLDDNQKSDDASKQIQKVFTMIPADNLMLKFSLLHLLTHFSRKSPGGLLKVKMDMNDQLQKAVILYQGARSNNQTQTKDLAEAFKICTTFLDTKKDVPEETACFEILSGEIGRLAAQFGQTQLAQECAQRASGARAALARIHAILINAQLALDQQMSPDEIADVVSTCAHCMSLAQAQGDTVLVQDAAAMLWSHSLNVLHRPGLIKRHLLTAVEILSRIGSQANLMRSEMHFALAKIFEADRDNLKALDQLKKAIALDYLSNDHPTKLQHPFDRFLFPFYKMLSVNLDSFGQQVDLFDRAYAPIAQSRRPTVSSLNQSLEILNAIKPEDTQKFDAVEAAHFAGVWSELIKSASQSQVQIAVDSCKTFLSFEFDNVQYDAAVEIQCESVVPGITSAIASSRPQDAVSFLQFAISKGKVLKNSRIIFNAITAIWNSFFSRQEPARSTEFVDVVGDCVTTLFELDFEPAKKMIGQIVNYFVQILLEICTEPPPASQASVAANAQNTQQAAAKKKGPTLDATKQKQLKLAEDTALKALPVVSSIYEKKALVDRLVEIFARRNALPPNQSDPETSILVQLATIMNEKVQHKSETLSSIYSSLQNLSSPALYAILSERSNKLDLGQLTIDSATKMLELTPSPNNPDELYYCGLARFTRGFAYLKLIQPDLQEFSCQDKLRVDAANDFLNAAINFSQAQNIDNAKLSLSFFCSTISDGENFPKFRQYLSEILPEALSLTKQIQIGDDMRVSIFRIYLQVLIDQKDWTQCRKLIHDAITSLDKNVHNQLWELNLIVTANADCSKSQTPLIDEMLRVKQLGDSKYQSRLWTFVSDLATDCDVKRTALMKAEEVLKENDITERFRTAMNFAKWLETQDEKIEVIEEELTKAKDAALLEENNLFQTQRLFEIDLFRLKTTKDISIFNESSNNIIKTSESFWQTIAEMNQTTIEEEATPDKKKGSARASKSTAQQHKTNQPPPKEETPTDFKQIPSNIAQWQELMKQVDKHKCPEFENPYDFANMILEAVQIIQYTGNEYNLMTLWYIVMLISKILIHNSRLEQIIYMSFLLFLDRLDQVSTLPYDQDFGITDSERMEWNQKVERYQSDPPSELLPLRKTLLRQCFLLLELGDIRPALTIAEAALSQAEELQDTQTMSEANICLAIINIRSGNLSKAVEKLQCAAPEEGMPLDNWLHWFSTAFTSHEEENRSAFVHAMIDKFVDSCVKEDMSINETIKVYNLYKYASEFMNADDAKEFFESISGKLILPNSFIPSIDIRLSYLSRMIKTDKFPAIILEYRSVGRDMIQFINAMESSYATASEKGAEASIPILMRYVEVINIFGTLVVGYRPQIENMRLNGLDYEIIGSHDSILNEFIDKEQEPLVDLSATSAIMYFNSVQNIEGINKRLNAHLELLLGRCLHIIAKDVVTTQNAVKYLWNAVPLLIELDEDREAEDTAIELLGILKGSDPAGSVQMFVSGQNSRAYLRRFDQLEKNTPPENRERLFVEENKRLSFKFHRPEISPLYVKCQRFLKEVPSITALLKAQFDIEQFRKVCTEKKLFALVVDNTSQNENNLIGSVIAYSNEKDIIEQELLKLDLETIAYKVEIFKQIIAPPKKAAETPANEGGDDKKKGGSPRGGKGKGKKGDKGKAQEPPKQPVQPQQSQDLGAIAGKVTNPEFIEFIDKLTKSFEPIVAKFPEGCESILLVSSIPQFHTIPFSAIPAFSKYQVMYHDYSIISAMARKEMVVNLSKDTI